MKERIREYFYYLSRFICYLFYLVWFRISIKGSEHLPEKGAYVFASNHASHLDPVICGIANKRPLLYLAKKELFRNPFFGWLLRTYYVIPLDRSKGDIKAIKIAINILKSGKPVLLYPEGTRSRDGEIGTAKRGIGFILEKTGVPVTPCYIDGSGKALHKGSKMVFPVKIRVFIGKPLHFDDIFALSITREEKQTEIGNRIIRSIKELKSEMDIEI